jgi:putative selenium metabolism protein SsnA
MLITNANVITWEKANRILTGYAVLIQGGKITGLGPTEEMKRAHPEAEELDAGGQYLMPGLICAHTHFYGAFARGMAIPGAAADSFPQILAKLWWPLDKALSMPDVNYSAQVCLIDAIKHGTTTLIDHHASPTVIDGSLDTIADAVEQAGVRASLCYEVTDRNGKEGAWAGIAENKRFIRRVKADSAGGRLAAKFGLHASLTVSEETLSRCREAAGGDEGFHIHVAEHEVDEYDSLAKTGKRVVDRLNDHGILGSNSIIVHAVHVDAKEINLLAETRTWVSHQPRSNMNNAVGLPRVEEMMRAGVRVCLGNDGFSNAMWDEWKAAYLSHKLYHRDPRRMGGYDVVEMAIYNNAELVTQHFGAGRIGSIEVGAAADLILVDYHPYTELSAGNLPWHILFGFEAGMVTSTMVAGKLLMHKRQLLTLDEAKISREAQQLSAQTWQRYSAQF